MDKVRIRFSFLAPTEEEKQRGIVRLLVDDTYLKHLRAYAHQHFNNLSNQMAIISDWDWDYTAEAFSFFHWVRDQIVKIQSGKVTKTEAETLKKQLKAEFGPHGKTSLKEYSRYELWQVCEGAVQWLGEAGGSIHEKQIEYQLLKEERDERV